MDICLVILWALVVNDVGDIINVNTAGRHIGSHQHIHGAVAECIKSFFPGHLAQIAVDGSDPETALRKFFRQLLGGALSPGKEHRLTTPLGLQNARYHLCLVKGVGSIHKLDGVLMRSRGIYRLGPNMGGLAQERSRETDDGSGHGGREEHRLPILRNHAKDLLHIGKKSQVQHFIGLIQYQHSHLAKDEVMLLGQIHQSAGGTYYQINPLLQSLNLRLVGGATIDR